MCEAARGPVHPGECDPRELTWVASTTGREPAALSPACWKNAITQVIEANSPECWVGCATVGLMGAGGTYRLEVKGELGDLAGRSFPRMRIVYKNGNTVLLGPVRDQAELTGMLQRFMDLGVSLVSVTVLDDLPRQ